MIHLYCLRCNRPNEAGARYCSGCGAGLLRQFCAQCHAANDVESRYCHACGAALPAPANLPELTTEVEIPPSVPAMLDVAVPASSGPSTLTLSAAAGSLAVHDAGSHPMIMPLQAAQAPGTTSKASRLSPASLAVAALACAAVLSIAVAMKLWPASALDAARPGTVPHDAAAGMKSMASPARIVPIEHVAPSAIVDPAKAAIGPDTPAVDRTGPPVDAAASAAGSGDARKTVPGASTAVRRIAPPARPPAPEPAAAPVCTPEVHALSLCAPGATIVRRP